MVWLVVVDDEKIVGIKHTKDEADILDDKWAEVVPDGSEVSVREPRYED